jgi:hypothetical protein
MGKYGLIGFLLGLLVLVVVWAVYAWNAEGPAAMTGHFYVAMGLGIFFSLVVGVGLMTLVFYSSRQGYDEPPERERP